MMSSSVKLIILYTGMVAPGVSLQYTKEQKVSSLLLPGNMPMLILARDNKQA